MTNKNDNLEKIYETKRQQVSNKVDTAIQKLLKEKKAINFNSVAEISGVSKTTLYRRQDLKERIESLRQQQQSLPTAGEIKMNMTNENKDAIIASLKRTITKLRKENEHLREIQKKQWGKNLQDFFKE